MTVRTFDADSVNFGPSDCGWVYFAERGGLIKIGWSATPRNRVEQLDAHLLGAIPGDRALETSLHARFAPSRYQGEWFRFSLDLIQAIADLTRQQWALQLPPPAKIVAKFPIAAEDLDRYAGIPEAAARLRINRATAYRMINDGRWDAEVGVPVVVVAGKQHVSLRRLVEFINGTAPATELRAAS